MKNIHIIPTDKPCEFYSIDGKHKLANSTIAMDWYISSVGYKPHNIYITSDEEIKDGEKCITFGSDKCEGQLDTFQSKVSYSRKPRKIILTTDQELIKDDVQAIDDEFLEWFVNNSSCEEVEVKKFNGFAEDYLIIIPKEEPNFYEKLVEYFKNTPREKILEDWNKTAECDNIGPTVEEFLGNTEEPKQEYQSECICDTECRGFVNVKCKKSKKETLEEAAIRLYPDNIIKLGNDTSYNAALLKRKNFIDGGNWVKERMYSEEDMREAIHESRMQDDKYEDSIFEQFKKK